MVSLRVPHPSRLVRRVRIFASFFILADSQFGNLGTTVKLNLDRIPSPCYRETFLLPAPNQLSGEGVMNAVTAAENF
jgi:hypothetical protein